MKGKILLVEDEQKLRRVLKLVLMDEGYEVCTSSDGKMGIACWQQEKPDLVITDLKMKPLDGLAVLRYGVEHHSHVPCLMLTAFGTVELAVSAMKLGAYDFLTKPVDHSELLKIVAQALSERISSSTLENNGIIGVSAGIEKLNQDIALLAPTNSAVLVRGESGTGKDLVARALHQASKFSSGPFIRVNCASIPKDLLESSLFGHKKGAFTGATENRLGAFMQASGGTLFLDEIGDLDIDLQPKILHAVEEKEVTPVGSNTPVPISVRIISATNQYLEDMVDQKLFRLDLLYRLNTIQIEVPPLRKRLEDLPFLADHFIGILCKAEEKPPKRLHKETTEILKKYSWPGNVRELRNLIERIVISCSDSLIHPNHLPSTLRADNNRNTLHNENGLDLVAQEQELLLAGLKKCNWNQSRAAKLLGITRSALRYRLKKYGISNRES